MSDYKILCPKCKTDLTELISERVRPVIEKIAQIALKVPDVKGVQVANAKAKTTCPSCGLQAELNVNLDKLAEMYLERMK